MTDDALLSRTLRTTAAMLGACVLFLGALSLTLVVVLSRPLGTPAIESSTGASPSDKDAKDAKPAKPARGATTPRQEPSHSGTSI